MALFISYQDLVNLTHQEFPLICYLFLILIQLKNYNLWGVYSFLQMIEKFSLYSLPLYFIMLSDQFPVNHFQMFSEMKYKIKCKARKI